MRVLVGTFILAIHWNTYTTPTPWTVCSTTFISVAVVVVRARLQQARPVSPFTDRPIPKDNPGKRCGRLTVGGDLWSEFGEGPPLSTALIPHMSTKPPSATSVCILESMHPSMRRSPALAVSNVLLPAGFDNSAVCCE